jgi:phthalate 4,5-dioxygenase oxygenase subunit
VLNREQNELICRVGPGTPMNALMREYWLPAMVSSELPAPDCDPVRVMLLGERLVAFRDSEGTVGLLPHNCPHRGASLFFGRNEEGGLRCVYHGWKFDVAGRCLDMPNEPADSNFKDKVRARAYPCVERGGIVWTYMGPREEPPPIPAFEYFDAPTEKQSIFVHQLQANWLQTLEGDVDTTHFGLLHLGHVSADAAEEGTFLKYMLSERAARYKLIDTDVGATYGAYRPTGEAGETYWRVGHFLSPFYTMPPVGALGTTRGFVARVPMDDEHTLVIETSTGDTAGSIGVQDDRLMGLKIEPHTTGWYGRFRVAQTLDNDYEIDRARQRSGESYTGLASIALEDEAVTESMGPIVDRSKERLGVADMMIIRVRRRLLGALAAHQSDRVTPPGVEEPDGYRKRPGGIVLPADADWVAETKALREGAEEPTVDPAVSAGV